MHFGTVKQVILIVRVVLIPGGFVNEGYKVRKYTPSSLDPAEYSMLKQ